LENEESLSSIVIYWLSRCLINNSNNLLTLLLVYPGDQTMLVPVVLAVGVGARLWPSSRALLPKQFIQFPQQQESLFHGTIRRLKGLEEIGYVLVVCSEDHRFLVAEQLRQLGKDHSTILLEPLSRNTAPDFALAVLSSQQDAADLILLVLPGDHVIINTPAFHRAITQGVELVRQDMLVVFGIVPGDQKRVMGILRKAKSWIWQRRLENAVFLPLIDLSRNPIRQQQNPMLLVVIIFGIAVCLCSLHRAIYRN
jgi:hypothetical protein